jgi:DnaJ-class molecular chaperone
MQKEEAMKMGLPGRQLGHNVVGKILGDRKSKNAKCPHCKGSGNLYYQPCDFCGGSGQKKEKEEKDK